MTVALDLIFDTADHGATDMQFFFGTAGRPIGGIADTVSGSVSDVTTIVDNSDWVVNDMGDITARFTKFSSTYQSTLNDVGQASTLNDVVSNLDTTVDPITTSITELLTTLKTQLVEIDDMIQEGASGALDQINAMNDTIVDMRSQLATYQEQTDSTNDLRQKGVLAVFAVALVFVCLGFVGVISAFTPCKFDDYLEFLLHFTWMFGSLIGTVAFIIGGAALTLSIGWSDACIFMDVVKEDFTILGDMAGTGLNACYNDTALIQAFNMTKQLEFADPLRTQLGQVTDLDITTQFKEIKDPVVALGDQMSTITLTDIGGTDLIAALAAMTNSEAAIKAAAGAGYDSLNAADKCCYTISFAEGQILEPWTAQTGTMPCSGENRARSGAETNIQYITRLFGHAKCNDYVADINKNIVDAYTGMVDILNAKNGMLADIGTDSTFCQTNTCPTASLGYSTTIYAALGDYEGQMNTLVGDFTTVGDGMLDDLITHVEDFKCNMKCGFLASFMDELQDNWCKSMLSGVLDISLSLILLAFFNVPVCICAAILVNRFRGKWRCGVGGKVFAGADEGGRTVGTGKAIDDKQSNEQGDTTEGDVQMVKQQESEEFA